MGEIIKKPLDKLGYNFIDERYIPEGKNEYYLRDEFLDKNRVYRSLVASEIEVLVKNDNTSDDWNAISVSHQFNPNLVKRCNFYGKVRIGNLEPVLLEHHDLQLAVGIYNSNIVSSDLGNNVAIHNVNQLAHYQVDDDTILFNVNEITVTNRAKFGNGVIKEGETEANRVWVELCNENTGRKVLAFEGMLPGDAYLWTRLRGDEALQKKFVELTEKQSDKRRGRYGYIGKRNIIKNSKIIKDVRIGDDAYIKGANKLKNLTIRSSAEAPTQIGEGVELVNGIIGFGCRVFYGSKAIRFIMGAHSGLKYGARLINSFLGNNSTISCCEVLNTLIFPAHEQHHNNSFLCAATIMGQSNIAAGVTIGSNHNSRGNDGEIVAGRGFWPGLCVSLKHNSKFASFTLINKGDYPAEIHLQLPFSLISNDETEGCIKILPAYWFQYNMYALARNSWKFDSRDKRHLKIQRLEYDFLAPDTVNEIFDALRLLEIWTAKSYLKSINEDFSSWKEEALKEYGKKLILHETASVYGIKVFADGVENTRRPTIILKPVQAYMWYVELIHHYAVQNLVRHTLDHEISSFEELTSSLKFREKDQWTNVGGQLIRDEDVNRLVDDIKTGLLDSWERVHQTYVKLGDRYLLDKTNHAYSSLLKLLGVSAKEFTLDIFSTSVEKSSRLAIQLADLVYESRKKDYENPFRRMTYSSTKEHDAVVGKLQDNDFIRISKEEATEYAETVEKVMSLFIR